jgi:hypothetical protein
MIVFIIYIKCITALNLECNSPVPTDLDRPSAFTISLERVETQAWQIHIFKRLSRFKERENLPDSRYLLRINTAGDAGFE